MATVYDVEADKLIDGTAKTLKEDHGLKTPQWAMYVKTGSSKERKPVDEDWWFIRAASILRRIYMEGPVGVERLRSYYGSRKNRGRKPSKFRRASGKIIRQILKQLDDAGLTQSSKAGRKITQKGQSCLDKISSDITRKG